MTGELSGDDKVVLSKVVRWLRGIPQDWREDWGLNATEEIADLLESGLWLLDGAPDNQSEEK